MARILYCGLIGLLFATNSFAAAPPKNQAPSVALTAPASGATFTAPAAITLAANASDSDGSVARVEFYRGSTLIGTDSSSPYTIEWSSVGVGAYLLTAKAFDNASASATSAAVSIQVVASSNVPPSVALVAPMDGAIFEAPAVIQLSATASDSDGTVTQVQFFNDAAQIGVVNSAPYSISWNNVGIGTYTLTARATDNTGATTSSGAATIEVRPSNTAPLAVITAPVPCATIGRFSRVELRADAVDPDGEVAMVEYFDGGTSIGSSNTPPYNITWSNRGTGVHSIIARATDKQGKSGSSSPIQQIVPENNALPAVTLIAPVDQTSLPLGSKLIVEATASDSDGAIARVGFYEDNQLIATVTSPPYSIEWTPSSLGTRVLTARAVDDLDDEGTSSAVNVSVNPNVRPSVVITAPNNGAIFGTSTTVTLSADASDTDGSVTSVDFYRNSTILIGRAVAPPYRIQWSNPPLGDHAITAVALDGSQESTTSTSVGITVRTNSAPNVLITSPESGSVFVAPANLELRASVYDGDGTVSQVEFFNGTATIGIAYAEPYSITWNNVPIGTYTIRAIATDDLGAKSTVKSALVYVAVPPTVSLVTPAAASRFSPPASIPITANASDSDGSIAKVEFLNGTQVIATVTAAPYTFTWNNVPIGNYTLFARATDDHWLKATSAGVGVSVSSNSPPVVSLTSPGQGAQFGAPASISLAASASDSDGSIAKIEFLNGSAVIGTRTSAPYTFNWTNVAAGTYTVLARATDDGGAITTSAGIDVSVLNNSPPTVALTSPNPGAQFAAPASITIAATASDSDGSVARVEFLNGSAVIGTKTTPPYTFNWTNVPAGDYGLFARATDDLGQTTTSVGALVSVANSGITILSPAPGASLTGDSVLVRGRFVAPPNSGITVNNSVASVDDSNQFYAMVPLHSGSNTVTVTLTTQTATLNESITISSDGVRPDSPIEITADELEGFAPYRSTFTMKNVTTEDVSIRVNAYQPIVLAAGGSMDYDLNFSGPGAYTVSISCTDQDDQTVSREYIIAVRSAAQVDQTLQSVWSGMKDALIAGDQNLALAYLSASARDRYGPVFEALSPMMEEIFAAGSPLLPGQLSIDIGEYAMVRQDSDGQPRVYLVYFLRGADGVWRLESM